MGEAIHVLVVDEDQDVLELTKTFLERESDDISVTTREHVAHALEYVEEGSVDCVVSDYRMPGMDGLQFFERAREHDPSLPFFLFSAAVDRETIEKAEAAGVTKFVKKGAGTDFYRELAHYIEEKME